MKDDRSRNDRREGEQKRPKEEKGRRDDEKEEEKVDIAESNKK